MRRVIARLCFSNRKIRSCREKVSFCVVVVLCVFNLLSNEVIAVSEHSTLVVVTHCSFGIPVRQDLWLFVQSCVWKNNFFHFNQLLEGGRDERWDDETLFEEIRLTWAGLLQAERPLSLKKWRGGEIERKWPKQEKIQGWGWNRADKICGWEHCQLFLLLFMLMRNAAGVRPEKNKMWGCCRHERCHRFVWSFEVEKEKVSTEHVYYEDTMKNWRDRVLMTNTFGQRQIWSW